MERFEAEMEKVEKDGVRDGFPARPGGGQVQKVIRDSSRRDAFGPRPGRVETSYINREVELDNISATADSYWLDVVAAGDAQFQVVASSFSDGSGAGGLLVIVESMAARQAKFRLLVIRGNVPFTGNLRKLGLFGNRSTGFFHVHVSEPEYGPRPWE